MSSLVQRYKQDAASRGKDLVLVTFEHGAEWRYLTLYFPSIAQCFTSWLDIRELAKADALRCNTPTLKTCLACYGYHWRDITCATSIASGQDYEGQERNANGHNAGNGACMTLTLLECLQDPDFRRRLSKRQVIEAIVKPFKAPSPREPYVATFESGNPKLFPGCLGSGYRAARYFWDFEPTGLGLKYKSRERGNKDVRKLPERGWVAFGSKDHLERFIDRCHNRLIGSVTLKVAKVDRDGTEFRAVSELRQSQMEQVRQQRKRSREAKEAQSEEYPEVDMADLFGSDMDLP
ncbi:hypothetical protein PG985_009470 [Apiospora marii]|uniref:uncharacterized protein n=1 Tax=Apiospora marii TaxID=335849 RepID=UPI00312FC161